MVSAVYSATPAPARAAPAIPGSALVIAPGLVEYVILALATVLSLIGVSMDIGVPQWFNVPPPVMIAVALSWGCYVMLRRDRVAVWLPMLWFRAVMIAYSGIGTLVPVFGNDATLKSMNSFYELYPADIAKYNLVICVFTLLVLLCATLSARGARLFEALSGKITATRSALDTYRFGLVALAVGTVVQVFTTYLPTLYGAPPYLTGSVGLLALAANIGYAMLVYVGLSGRRSALWIALPLAALAAFFGLLNFNKTEIIMPMMFVLLGAIHYRARLGLIMAGSAVIVLAYMSLMPLASYGRQVDWQDGGFRRAQFSRSLEILSAYSAREANRASEMEQAQDAWQRLSYVGPGAFAIALYDQGRPGNSLQGALLALVPRIVWPDKPIVTDIAREFNYAATGNWESQSVPGIPAEGYWVGGWIGVLGYALVFGWVVVLWSYYAIGVVRGEAWHLMLIVALGIRVATRVDGMLVTDTISMVIYAVAAHVVLSLLNSFALTNPRSPLRQPAIAGGAAG